MKCLLLSLRVSVTIRNLVINWGCFHDNITVQFYSHLYADVFIQRGLFIHHS